MSRISSEEFDQKIEKLCHLCGFVVKKVAIESYYDALRNEDRGNVLGGLKLMTQDPPSKLTLKAFKYFINQTKTSLEKPEWDGKPCSDPDCSMGLIAKIFNGRSYSFRCSKCNSNCLKILPHFSEENVRIAEEHSRGERVT